MKMKTSMAAKGKKSSRSKKAGVNMDESSDNLPEVDRRPSKAATTPPKASVKKKQVAGSDDSSHSSDNEPLIKMKTSAQAKKTEKKEKLSKSNGTNTKKTDRTTDSSDNEPLIKISKVSSKAAKKPLSVPPKDCVDKQKEESSADGSDSDDEPLSKIAKNIKQRWSKAPAVSPKKEMSDLKPKRNRSKMLGWYVESSADSGDSDNEPLSENAKKLTRRRKKAPTVSPKKEMSDLKPKGKRSKKIVKYAESSSNSSDDEPLATVKKKVVQKQKTTQDNKTQTKFTSRSLEDSSDKSSDDDVPLVNLMKEMKPAKKNTKTAAVSQGSTPRKRQGVSDESSDDEPLINITKKNRIDNQTTSKTKASAPKKREIPPKKPRTMPMSGSSSNSSVGEIKSNKHPQVTKVIRIMLKRCDGEDAGATGSFNKTKTAEAPVAEELRIEEPESSE